MDRQGTSSEKIVVSNIDVKNFTPGGERTKSHGNLYHWQQLMLFFCKSIASNISFKVTCEIEEAGKFDDIVIFYERNEKTLCRLIQIKHRENISKVLTFKDLTGNKNFKLKTYFDSYVEMKNDVKFEQKYGCEIEELIICTNVDFDVDLKKCMEVVPDSIFNKYGLFRVKSSETEFKEKLIGGNNNAAYEEFFHKLRFAVKQPDGEDLKYDIKCKIFKYLEEEHPEDSLTSDRIETIYVTLLTKIIDFDTNREVQVVTDEGYLNWLHEAFNSKENQLTTYHRYNLCVVASCRLRFERESVEELEKFVIYNESSLSLVISCADTIFTVQKLIQIFNVQNRQFRLILDKQVVVSMWNMKRDFLSSDRCEYLVVVCKSNEISEQVFKTVTDICNGINKSLILNKRIVLISNPEVKTENYTPIFGHLAKFKDHVEWDDFDEKTRDYVLNKQIVFQGQLVPFSAIDISHVRDSIKDRVLFDIVLSDKYEIGKPFHDLKTDDMSYFVPRNILVFDEIRNPFYIFEFDYFFAIENIDKSLFENYMSSVSSVSAKNRSRYFRLNNETAAEEFEKISYDNKDKKVSWIHYKDGTFRWKKSNVSISIIKQYLKTSSRHKIKLQTVSNIENKSILVIGEPGMGKSTLLSSLATRSIEQSPDVWVIKIDLNNHTKYFYDLLKSSTTFSDKNDVIEFITSTQKFCGFEKTLFESYFQIENKLVVLLDGFDEIAPHYKNIVVDLVKIIQSSHKIKMWITSRPHETVFLEEQLVLLPYFLSKFTVEDQRHFFRMFWEKHIDKTDSRMKRLDRFVDCFLNTIFKSLCTTDDLLLTSIPLQCKMFADVYTDAFIKFYKNETDDTGILDAVDILDLYNRFIEIKCEINIEEKKENDITKPGNMTEVEKEIKKITSRYKLLCLSVIFEKEDERTLLTEESKELIQTSLSDIKNGVDKYGIVRSVENGIPVFVHRTFAEYFAAIYLRDFVDNSKNEQNDRVAFVKSKLFESKYAIVRRFFDRLTGTNDIFKYALNGDKKQLCKILENDPSALHRTDKFGRNVLHLIAGYNYTEDICKYLVESDANTTQKDELFGLKPVEYAVALKLWGNVNELIVGNENDRAILRSIEDKEELMCTAGTEGWPRLIKYFVEIDKMSVNTNKKGISILHLAASRGHVEICRYLIKTGANIKNNLVGPTYTFKNIEYDIFENETPFHIAIKKGFVKIVKLFIENDRNIIENICYKETLLHSAMESGNVEMLRILVDHGANVNSVNEYRETPLHITKKDINIDVIDFLLERGANIEALDNHKCNPLMNYVEVGNVSVVRHLLTKGADIYHCDEDNNTVLHLAVLSNRLNILKVLIAHDPNIVMKIHFSETLLHEAVRSGNTDMLELLIRNGADVNGRNENEETPLHISGRKTKTEIIDTLLNAQADIDAMDRDGNTPLIKYTKDRNLSIVQHLMEKGANLHHCPKNGQTVLHHAACKGYLNMVEIIIAHDATIMNDANVSETVLHAAMISGELKMIEVLIRHGANVNGRNSNYETPLHMALQDTSIEIIDNLLSHSADINATDLSGNTPLIKYTKECYLSIVHFLVEKGANIRHCSKNGQTVLHHAASRGNLKLVEMLIERDATIMKDANVTETALHAAMKSGKLEIIEVLIRHGANVNSRNENGEVPLHIATKDTDVGIIDVLLKSGTNINETSDDGSTPLIKYAEADNVVVVERLVILGADVRHCPANNRTALHCAAAVGNLEMVELFIRLDQTIVETIASANTLLHEAMEFGNTEVIKLLIDRGADVNSKNEKGETPLHIADRRTNIAVIKLLLKQGADVEARDNDRNTPIMRFEYCEHIEACQLLRTFIEEEMPRSEKMKKEAKKKKTIGCFNIFKRM